MDIRNKNKGKIDLIFIRNKMLLKILSVLAIIVTKSEINFRITDVIISNNNIK
ncbi:hypothetical protein CM15mP94_3660 [bacterium]|nr:MAG: hypothetical protein CM15mP94_3660 [bacterium]